MGLTSCNTDMMPQQTPSPTAHIYSRGENNKVTIDKGNSALFNAKGRLNINNEIFTFDGNSWKNNTDFKWIESEEITYISAITPAYDNQTYTTEKLYRNNKLEDILMAKDTLLTPSNINLQFKHLFSSLDIKIESSLLEKITKIEVTTPYIVSEISPLTGEIETTQANHTTLVETDGSQDYTVILPPATDCILTLVITMANGEKVSHSLTKHTFESGVSYECNLVDENNLPGIRNANDLIDFCQLINGTYQGTKTLNDFGKNVDGKMVYPLLKDIELTEEDCAKLSPIANDTDEPFNGIFDGRGFTISNLILPDLEYTGLFGYIGTDGIVKNLHINNANMKGINKSKYVGAIAAKNSGLIDGCSVQSSTISSITGGKLGPICALSPGYIINCYTQNDTIEVHSSSTAGAIVSNLNGRVVNCYSYKNHFSTSGSDFYIGSIAGTSFGNSTYINNCYIYHSQTTSNWKAAVGSLQKGTIRNFYYNKGATENQNENIQKYDASTFQVNGTHISTLLNNWVTDPNRTTYSGYTFKRWKIADDGSACFQ